MMDRSSDPNGQESLKNDMCLARRPCQAYRIWIDEEMCTSRGAKWAYNTSCRMMKEFAKLAQGIVQATCQDYAESFKEL